jgi:hypothetical protein
MRIKIVLVDEGNGSVRIDCHPPIPNLIKAWKAGDQNPVLAYAIAAIQRMKSYSDDIQKEQDKERQEAEMMNGLYLPDPRLKQPKQIGPTEVN